MGRRVYDGDDDDDDDVCFDTAGQWSRVVRVGLMNMI